LKNTNNNGFRNNKNFFRIRDIKKIKTTLHSQRSPLYVAKNSFLSYDCSSLLALKRICHAVRRRRQHNAGATSSITLYYSLYPKGAHIGAKIARKSKEGRLERETNFRGNRPVGGGNFAPYNNCRQSRDTSPTYTLS